MLEEMEKTNNEMMKQAYEIMKDELKKNEIDERYEKIEYGIKGAILNIVDIAGYGGKQLTNNFSGGFLITACLVIIILLSTTYILRNKEKKIDDKIKEVS